MKTIKMGRGGRLNIPLELWDQIGVKPGDTVELTVTEAGVLELRKYLEDLKDQMGSVKVNGQQDFEQIREEVKRKRGKLRGE